MNICKKKKTFITCKKPSCSANLKFKFLILLFLLSNTSIGQNKNALSFGGKYYAGFQVAHNNKVKHLVTDYIKGIEMTIFKQTDGNEYWHNMYNFPQYGLSLLYLNAGNFNIGKIGSISPYINFAIKKSSFLNLNFRLALGVGYVEKPFDRLNNYKNVAIGSHLNALGNFSINSRLKITKKIGLDLGISFMHMSNGATQNPNYGLNMLLLDGGIQYFSKDYKFQRKKIDTEVDKKREYFIIPCFGYKQLYFSSDIKYLTLSFISDVQQNINRKQALGIGFDIFYDFSTPAYLRYNKNIDVQQNLKYTRIGFNFLHNLKIHKFAIIFNFGTYLFSKHKKDGLFYQRIALRYDILEHFKINISLKTHYGKADYIEWGIGYQF